MFEGVVVLKEPDVFKCVCISVLNLTDPSDWQCIIKQEIGLLGTKRDPCSWQRRVRWEEIRRTKCSIFYSLKSFPFPEPRGQEFTSCLLSREIPVFLSHRGEQIRGCSAGAREAGDR